MKRNTSSSRSPSRRRCKRYINSNDLDVEDNEHNNETKREGDEDHEEERKDDNYDNENENLNVHENNNEIIVENESNNENDNDNVEGYQENDNENNGRNDDEYASEDNEYELTYTPLDDDLLPLMERLNEIKIEQLEGEETNKINLNRSFIDVQLLRLITPSSQQKAMAYGVRRRINSNQEIIFSRLLLCRVHSQNNYYNGSKLIYLMESKNSNQNMFNSNVEFRDNGVISIGTFFRVVTPLPIENKMRGDIPLIKTHIPLIVMKRPIITRSIRIRKEIGNLNSLGFVLVGMNIYINRSTAIKTTCGGLLCDKQRCSDWNGTRGCGCYNFRDDISNIAFEHSVFFQYGNDTIQHHDFSSTKFSSYYLTHRLPSTVTASALTMTQEYFDIEESIADVIGFVNENGGWTVIGWYKRGIITDKSLLEVPPSNVVSTEVASGLINYHIVQLLPTNNEFMNKNSDLYFQLHQRKYDTSQMQQTY